MSSFIAIPLFMLLRGVLVIPWIAIAILLWRTARASESTADALKCMLDKMCGGGGALGPRRGDDPRASPDPL